MTSLRIVVAVLGFASVLVAPPWVALVCMVILAVRFRAWEAIALGLCLDLIWLPFGAPYANVPFYTIASIIIVWGLEPLRLELLR